MGSPEGRQAIAFGVAGGQGPVLLEPVDAPLDEVAAAVAVRIERRRSSAGPPAAAPMSLLVLAFGNGGADAAAAQQRAGGPGGVGLVGDHVLGAGARPADPTGGHPDRRQQPGKLRIVAGLPGREQHGQRPPAALHGEVELATQPSAGPAEGLSGNRLDPRRRALAADGRPLFRAPAACWWARTTVESTATIHSTGCPSGWTCK